MNQAGTGLLALAAAASLAGLFLSLSGAWRRSPSWTRYGFLSVHIVLTAAAAATLVLLAAFLARDFGNLYVYQHSTRALPLVYTVSALWAGNAGSLLVWLLLLSVFTTIATRAARRRDAAFAGLVAAVLSVMTLFFSLLILFGPNSQPFAANPAVSASADGLGLNPQLQNPGMIVHPLALFAGYVAMAIPFALLMAALVSGQPLRSWLAAVRAWVLAGWLFLTIGNVVGAWWAYVTLGWGGYWAWDPVENASLIPWLTATALLHAASVARRREGQKQWMASLVAATFLLTVFGTFLTRSGLAQSVHAFAESGLVPWFTAFLVLMLTLAVIVLVWRRGLLRDARASGAAAGDDWTFLYTNIILTVLAFVILWGVVFPPVANAVSAGTIHLDARFFNLVTVPLGLALVALLVFCMLARVRRGSWRRFSADLAVAAAAGTVTLVVLLAFGVRKAAPVAGFALSATAIAAIVTATMRTGLRWKRRRSYGALLIHLGLAIVIIAIAGSWAYKTSVEGRVSAGGSLALGGVQASFVGFETGMTPDKQVISAVLALSRDGDPAGRLAPAIEHYPAAGQNWTRVARRTSASDDIYVTLLRAEPATDAVYLRLERHPLIVWLWVGGGVMSLGGLVALSLNRRLNGPKQSGSPV